MSDECDKDKCKKCPSCEGKKERAEDYGVSMTKNFFPTNVDSTKVNFKMLQLNIIKRVAASHGATIEVDWETGQFWFVGSPRLGDPDFYNQLYEECNREVYKVSFELFAFPIIQEIVQRYGGKAVLLENGRVDVRVPEEHKHKVAQEISERINL